MEEIPIKRGNHKIGMDTLIFNITSSHECPSRPLDLCQIPDKCYGMKGERYNKNSLPYKARQTAYWDNTDAKKIAYDISAQINRKFKVKLKFLRLNETGDFRHQDDVDKAFALCRELNIIEPDFMVYCFTARSDLNWAGRPANFVVNGSGFMLDNSFTVVEKGYRVSGAEKMCGGNCRKCSLCKYAEGQDIKVEVH